MEELGIRVHYALGKLCPYGKESTIHVYRDMVNSFIGYHEPLAWLNTQSLSISGHETLAKVIFRGRVEGQWTKMDKGRQMKS